MNSKQSPDEELYQIVINELCILGLENFRTIIESYLDKFKEANIPVVLESSEASYLSKSLKMLVIGFLKKNNPRRMLWDLFHEYGHFLDGWPDDKLIKKIEYQIEREETAWSFAIKEIRKWKELDEFSQEIEIYKAFCLKTYYDKLIS